MDIIRKPYEISLWDDQLIYHMRKLELVEIQKADYKPGQYYSQNQSMGTGDSSDVENNSAISYTLDLGDYVDGRKYYTLTSKNNKDNYVEGGIDIEPKKDWGGLYTMLQYYKEIKLCIIGSNTMDAPIRAVKPKLTSKVNGENTFTFTIYSHYWSEISQKLEINPFLQFLTNERKVKLKYNGKWYDFIIKNITEDSSSKAFTYTCKDLYVNELSKTGFELEFDNELGNNMGTLPELASSILEGSDWELKDQTEVIKQYLEEALYEIELNKDITATVLYGLNKEGKEAYDYNLTIKEGQIIYVFYSSFNYTGSDLEISNSACFLYDPAQIYQHDDKNVIIGYDKDAVSGAINCTADLSDQSFKFVPDRRGQRLIRSQKTYFDPKLKRTVNVYDGGAVYGYKTSKYISSTAVQSYITNPSDFTSTSGWYCGKADSDQSLPTLTLQEYPILNSSEFEYYTGASYLKFKPKDQNQKLMNSGIWDHRSSIKNLAKGDTFILEVQAYRYVNGELVDADEGWSAEIYEYELNSGVYEEKSHIFDIGAWRKENNLWIAPFTCKVSISEEQFKNKKIGIFIVNNDIHLSSLYIKKIQFYPLIEKEGGGYYKPGDSIEVKIEDEWRYYNKNTTYTNEEDLIYLYRGPENTDYIPYYGEDDSAAAAYEKVRSIKAKESNRFNLLQSLCELFECWVEFEIEHELNGQISLDESFKQKKWVSYKKYIGKDNFVGFKYGINLKSIKRTLDSNGAITKIIVKDNANEFGSGGFCSIARAEENPGRDNALYNFDYYIGQQLLDGDLISKDLEGEPNNSQGYIGYYRQLKALNEESQEKAEILSKLIVDISNYDSSYQTYSLSVQGAEQDLVDQELKFRELTGVEISGALPEYQEFIGDISQEISDDNFEKDYPWAYYQTNNENNYVRIEKKEEIDSDKTLYARIKWWDSNEAQKIRTAIARDLVIIEEHNAISKRQEELKAEAELQRKNLEASLKTIRERKLELNSLFYKKYSRFIQEGSWISEDYYDDNLYYIDALSTLYTSSRPKVSYTIDVVEISQLEGYEDFDFKLGDKTYIEDKEFFGRAYDGSGRLYREEVIVSEITMELDQPESNKIKVQNYKTQFEDLFQRVAAATQQIEFSTGEYKRGASIVKPDGSISFTALQNSFTNNAFILQNAKDQSVAINDQGITATNRARPSEILRIVSGGILLSTNGGEKWTTGISANGINASCITTGQLNASEINITMGEGIAFRWDEKGISAYKRDGSGISPGAYTRFDQFGLYGINGLSDFDPFIDSEGNSVSYQDALAAIKDKASYGLTWNGFWLKNEDGSVQISTENDIQVLAGTQERIKIGRIGNEENPIYGICISDALGAPVMETDDNGELWLKNRLSIDTYNNKEVGIGKLDTESTKNSEHGGRIMDANKEFVIYEDGHVVAKSIEALGGKIGNMTIAQVEQSTYNVEITSNIGNSMLEGSSVILSAHLYKGNEEITENLSYQWYDNAGNDIDGETQSTYVIDNISFNNQGYVQYGCKIIMS